MSGRITVAGPIPWAPGAFTFNFPDQAKAIINREMSAPAPTGPVFAKSHVETYKEKQIAAGGESVVTQIVNALMPPTYKTEQVETGGKSVQAKVATTLAGFGDLANYVPLLLLGGVAIAALWPWKKI